MLLQADSLTVSVRIGDAEIAVLREVSFALERGQVLGLVGESGAGKTMLGRLIARLLPATFRVTSGQLRFTDDDLLVLPSDRHRALLGDRIAFIPQEPLSALNPALTIGQQFGEHLARLGVARPERRDQAAAALADVRLDDPAALLDRYPFQLSGGMCQRVLIAMAFASNPALIVADEPTTALDVTTQAHIVTLIRRLQAARGTGLLFITHDLRLAAHLCDDVLVLYAGDVVERGPAARVFAQPRHPYTRALKRANPPLTGPRRRLAALPDTMPGIATIGTLPGCRFAPRCPTADPVCAHHMPALRQVAPDHWARCAATCEGAPERQVEDMAAIVAAALPAAMAAPPVLELEAVSKQFLGRRRLFGRGAPITAVRSATLRIAPGEFVGVVGESGSGKSTLARLAMGLEEPTAGRIRLDGQDVTPTAASWARRIAAMQMVFQDPLSALNPRRRIEGLVTQAMEARALPRAKRQERAMELLHDVGLAAELAPRFPLQLSGGQRQRVNIARALCLTPRLLVADEIVSGLDVSVQAQILNLLLRLREEHGIALLFISHDLSVVRYLCDRMLVMYRGEIVEEGSTERVFTAPQHAYTRALLAAVPPEDPGAVWPPH